MRYLIGSIQDWNALFREAYRCTKPGGYIQSFEPGSGLVCDDDTIAEGSALHQWGKIFEAGGKVLGRSFSVLEDDVQRKGMEEAGFVDIEEARYKVPVGRWPKDPKLKEIGTCIATALERGMFSHPPLPSRPLKDGGSG